MQFLIALGYSLKRGEFVEKRKLSGIEKCAIVCHIRAAMISNQPL